MLKSAKLQDTSLINTFKDYGLTALNITLQEKTLSDTFQLDTVQELEINDAVTGKFLDYEFNFLVEETNRQDLIQSVKGMYDQDRILYSQVKDSGIVQFDIGDNDYNLPEKWGYQIYEGHIVNEVKNGVVYARPTASDFIKRIAEYMGYTTNIKIEDFTSLNVNGEIDITYANLLSNVFGWTSQVPQRQINVFIRGGVLNCIQRGKEETVFDISDLPHTRPIVNKKLLRTMWQTNNETDTNDYDNDNETPFTGTITFSPAIGTYSILSYSNGFLTQEKTTTTQAKLKVISTTTYDYWERLISGDKETYLSKKITETSTENLEEKEKTVDRTVTTYFYKTLEKKEIYLLSEEETTSRTTYYPDSDKTTTFSTIWKLSETKTISRRTLHYPLGNGWYGQAVFENGVLVGSNISQGKPGNRVSPYTVKRFSSTFITVADGDNSPLAAIDDKDFPVVEKDIKEACANAYEWLNRKIQEEISVDIIDSIVKGIPSLLHVIDFTERIKLDGKEYFLVSNNISFTPKSFIQKLRLVRWY